MTVVGYIVTMMRNTKKGESKMESYRQAMSDAHYSDYAGVGKCPDCGYTRVWCEDAWVWLCPACDGFTTLLEDPAGSDDT